MTEPLLPTILLSALMAPVLALDAVDDPMGWAVAAALAGYALSGST